MLFSGLVSTLLVGVKKVKNILKILLHMVLLFGNLSYFLLTGKILVLKFFCSKRKSEMKKKTFDLSCICGTYSFLV